METSAARSCTIGVLATVTVWSAAVLSVAVGVIARLIWAARGEVEFPLFAPFVIVAWVVAGGLFLYRVRAAGRPATWLVVLWVVLAVAALGTTVGYLAFMDYGRPTYRPRSEESVLLNQIAITVTSLAAGVLALVLLRLPTRTRRGR